MRLKLRNLIKSFAKFHTSSIYCNVSLYLITFYNITITKYNFVSNTTDNIILWMHLHLSREFLINTCDKMHISPFWNVGQESQVGLDAATGRIVVCTVTLHGVYIPLLYLWTSRDLLACIPIHLELKMHDSCAVDATYLLLLYCYSWNIIRLHYYTIE